MTTPTQTTCAADTWTKIAEDVTEGSFYLQHAPEELAELPRVWCCVLDHDDAAPTDLSLAFMLDGTINSFKRSVGSDIYLYPVGEAVGVVVDMA